MMEANVNLEHIYVISQVLNCWLGTYTERHSEYSQTSKMELFSSTIFAKSFILDVWLGSEYAFNIYGFPDLTEYHKNDNSLSWKVPTS